MNAKERSQLWELQPWRNAAPPKSQTLGAVSRVYTVSTATREPRGMRGTATPQTRNVEPFFPTATTAHVPGGLEVPVQMRAPRLTSPADAARGELSA
jgi:hypothetical protein